MCIPTFKCVYHMYMLQGACYHSMYPVGDGQDFSLFFHGLHVSHVHPRVLECVSCVYPKNKKCVSRAGVDTLYLQVWREPLPFVSRQTTLLILILPPFLPPSHTSHVPSADWLRD